MIDWSAVIIAAPNSPTMLEALKLHLGIADTEQDAALTRALNGAGPAVETHLGRAVAQREVVESFAGHFGTVMLKHGPVEGDPVVSLNGVEQDGYSVYRNGGLFFLSHTGWPHDAPLDWRMFDQVDVTYLGGYAELPSDLSLAVTYVAAGLFQSEGTGHAPSEGNSITRMSITDVGSISYANGSGVDLSAWGVIPPVAREMLHPYRRLVV